MGDNMPATGTLWKAFDTEFVKKIFPGILLESLAIEKVMARTGQKKKSLTHTFIWWNIAARRGIKSL
jgi:hypothetical protein